MKHLFSCAYGSRLYGTSTPQSDRDIKHIVLPSIDHLLLGKKVVNVVHNTNTKGKNSVDDVDEEFIPLQIFARDFMMGQTYALELAFAIDGNHAEQTFYNLKGHILNGHSEQNDPYGYDPEREEDSVFFTFVKELRTKFLTSNIKAMMGYVVNQANMYSFKGERLNAAREFQEILTDAASALSKEAIAEVTVNQIFAICQKKFEAHAEKYPKYFKITEYDIGQDRQRPCFSLLEKTFPFTNTLENALGVIQTVIKKYGARADSASETNVDWKATMHALRIVDEGLQILEHHTISFPFSDNYVEHLLAVKRGELPLEPIKVELADKLDRLKVLEQTTTLPAVSEKMKVEFDAFMVKWLRKFYSL